MSRVSCKLTWSPPPSGSLRPHPDRKGACGTPNARTPDVRLPLVPHARARVAVRPPASANASWSTESSSRSRLLAPSSGTRSVRGVLCFVDADCRSSAARSLHAVSRSCGSNDCSWPLHHLGSSMLTPSNEWTASSRSPCDRRDARAGTRRNGAHHSLAPVAAQAVPCRSHPETYMLRTGLSGLTAMSP